MGDALQRWGCIARGALQFGGALQSRECIAKEGALHMGVHCNLECIAIWGGALHVGVHYSLGGCIAKGAPSRANTNGTGIGVHPRVPSCCLPRLVLQHPAAPHHFPLPPAYPSARGTFGVWGFGFFGSE